MGFNPHIMIMVKVLTPVLKIFQAKILSFIPHGGAFNQSLRVLRRGQIYGKEEWANVHRNSWLPTHLLSRRRLHSFLFYIWVLSRISFRKEICCFLKSLKVPALCYVFLSLEDGHSLVKHSSRSKAPWKFWPCLCYFCIYFLWNDLLPPVTLALVTNVCFTN